MIGSALQVDFSLPIRSSGTASAVMSSAHVPGQPACVATLAVRIALNKNKCLLLRALSLMASCLHLIKAHKSHQPMKKASQEMLLIF